MTTDLLKANEPIGYLSKVAHGFTVVCLTCAASGESSTGCVVYYRTVFPYNQDCGICGKVLVQGFRTWPQLFQGELDMTHRLGLLACDMDKTCHEPVTHIGEKGFAYCANHAPLRQGRERTRRLRAWEIKELEAANTLRSFIYKPRGQHV